jgi:hypothetical protein
VATAPTVGVVGLKAFTRDWAKLTSDTGPLYKALAAAGRKAADPVAAATRATLPQDTGRLAGDVRASGTRSGAAVRMGRSSIRYAGWVEFGGTRKVPHRSTRDYNPRGRYLFPAAVSLASMSADLYSAATGQLLAHFQWTNQGANPHD